MTTVWSAGPRLLTSPTMAPGWGRPWHAIDCRAAAATLDGRLRRQQSRHRPAVGVGGLAVRCGHPARRCRALFVHRGAATPASECTFHENYVSLSVLTPNGRDGVGSGGGRRTYLSRLAVPIKDVSERCTSLEIVYFAWHVRWCDVCMPFDT